MKKCCANCDNNPGMVCFFWDECFAPEGEYRNYKEASMRHWFNQQLREIAPRYTGSILNVGAGDDKDGEGGFYRQYFKTQIYHTVDPNCNNVTYKNISQSPYRYITVLNFWTLEHIWNLEEFIKAISMVCLSNIILAVPTKYKYHPAPNDYWRFTIESVNKLLEPYFIIKETREFDNGKDQGGILVLGDKK